MFVRPIFRVSGLYSRCSYSTSSTTAPPMLLKIRFVFCGRCLKLSEIRYMLTNIHRKDLKAAMLAKDTARLSVLRSLLSSTLNASKTSSPIQTDMQMLGLLRKTSAQSKAASQEFTNAGRNDLASKEDEQIKILDEYAGNVEILGEEDMRRIIAQVVEKVRKEAQGKKVNMGDVLKAVFAPEVFGDKPVEKSEVAKIVKELLAAS